MKLPTRTPVRLSKASPSNRHVPAKGHVHATGNVTHKSQEGVETVLHETTSATPVAVENPEFTATAGVSMGLTIPGPPRSYMSARVDAACYLPCLPNAGGVQAAMQQAGELVQARLERDAQEIVKFFNG